jgi:L-fuconolactonase
VFDSHAHLIADDDAKYPPAPLSGALRAGDLDERFSAERLLSLMDAAGVARICAVQRAHIYGYDPSYVVDSAARYPDRMCAVVALDAVAANAPAQLRSWMGSPHVCGIRLAAASPQTRDTAWLDSNAALQTWAAADDIGAPMCVHVFKPVREQVLAALLPILRRFANTPVVIDHVAHLAWEDGAPAFGFDPPLAALADYATLYLKFTTINLRRTLDAGGSTAAALQHLVSRVGAERVMWGSDIAQTKGDYTQMAQMARDATADLSQAQRDLVLTGACAAVYGGM